MPNDGLGVRVLNLEIHIHIKGQLNIFFYQGFSENLGIFS